MIFSFASNTVLSVQDGCSVCSFPALPSSSRPVTQTPSPSPHLTDKRACLVYGQCLQRVAGVRFYLDDGYITTISFVFGLIRVWLNYFML